MTKFQSTISPQKSLVDRATPSSDDVLVRVENVSKKFCRGLKKSLWYGLRDVAHELSSFSSHVTTEAPRLRPDEFLAVDDVSFELRRGECLGLIGHNGAGKTTLLKMLNGLIKPDQGRIEMRGRIGALIALGAGFNPILTGRENIYVNASVLGMAKQEIDERLDEIIDFAEIREFIDAPVQSYSSGMAVRLGFAIAVKSRPDVLLLDEVLAVGDVGFQAKCFNALSDFRQKGTAFILVSHNMHMISRYSDRVLYMNRGRIAHLGDTDTGIEMFNHDMHVSATTAENMSTDWSTVYGNGRVILKSATFLNETGQAVDTVSPGDTFTLAIDYECPDGDVADAVLDIVARDQDGVLFQGTSDSYRADFGRLTQYGRLTIRFDGFPVNSPRIDFSFAVMSRRSGEYYDWKRHVRLKIASNPSLNGRIVLKADWQNHRRHEKPLELVGDAIP